VANINTSISALKEKITFSGGLQRANRFLVTFTENNLSSIPKFFTETTSNDGTPKSYVAETVLLPDVVMNTQADSLSGPGLGRSQPRGLSYKDGVLITFPVFGDYELPKAFDNWMKELYSENFGAGAQTWITYYYDDVIKNNQMQVKVIDLNGKIIATYTFYEIFPVEIAPIQFSSLANNEYLKITVRFAFRKYELDLTEPSN
jgi:hypothetical protein